MSELLTELRHELAPVEESIRRHRYLDQLEAGRVPERSLQAFAGEQHAIISSDRRSFEHVASRLASSAAAGFFAQIAAGEAVALGHLLGFARSLGLDEQALRAYEPQSGCQAYPAYVAWLALNGSPGDVALAILVNLDAWGANCARMAAALRDRYDVAFFEFFAAPAPGFVEQALALAEDGPPASARRAARLLQAYELLYWETFAGAL